jgi:2-keto-4-pentenoate hydratase
VSDFGTVVRRPTSTEIAVAQRQRAETVRRLRRAGQRIVGAKLALTTSAAQARIGAAGQIHGWLTDAMQIGDGNVHTSWTPGRSRGEGELAFLLGSSLQGPGLCGRDVLASTSAVCPALDLPSSPHTNMPHIAAAMIANNANAGHFVLGGSVDPRRFVESAATATVQAGESKRSVAIDLEVLADLVADFANELADTDGTSLPVGAVILTGGLTGSFDLQADSTIGVAVDDLATVTLHIGVPGRNDGSLT